MKRLAARRVLQGMDACSMVQQPFPKGATTRMTASWLAHREQPKTPNTALWLLTRDNHCLRPMPCLGRFGLLCIRQYNVDDVLVLSRFA